MEPEDLVFEGGMHPVHRQLDNRTRLLGNLIWFARQWHSLADNGILATDACCYIKTPTGFRRVIGEKHRDSNARV